MEIEKISLEEFDLVDIYDIVKTDKKIEMVDIQVGDQETFVLGNGVISHNSAIAFFTEIRDPEFQAGMPLKGKVLNVYNKSPLDAMENDEVADIITAIGLEFNEQMGDWITKPELGTYNIKYESILELDSDGNPIVKEVVANGFDRFLVNKRWVKAINIFEEFESHYKNYFISIEKIEDNTQLTNPDFFQHRRLFDYRGFRSVGQKVAIEIGKEKIVCYDCDDVLIDNKWQKVSFIMKKQPNLITQTDAPLTQYHKLLRPKFNAKLNYSQVNIATDADPDGSSISNLLVNLFHEYFPELFWNEEKAFVYRIIFPMIAATKGKKTKYFSDRPLYDAAREKGDIDTTWKITYFKGLASMETEDWKHVFENLEDYLFPIYDDGYMDELMQVFFDSHPEVRKEWLSIM